MKESKFRKTFKVYREENSRLVEWIIGLVIAELALILSLHLYTKDIIFYLFLFFSFASILVAVSIMYALVSSVDVDIYSAFRAVHTDDKMEEEIFGAEFDKRLGCTAKWIINKVVLRQAYKWLFCSFLISTVMLVVLIILNMDIVKNTGNVVIK